MTGRARARMDARFKALPHRPPSRAQRVVLAVVAIALPLALWRERGAAVGILAFAVYGLPLLPGAFGHRVAPRWSRRHVAMDAAFIVPLTFLGLAYLTDLALAVCLAIAAAAGAVLVPVAVRRRVRRPR